MSAEPLCLNYERGSISCTVRLVQFLHLNSIRWGSLGNGHLAAGHARARRVVAGLWARRGAVQAHRGADADEVTRSEGAVVDNKAGKEVASDGQVAFIIKLLVTMVAAGPVALPGCPEACGNITVPYPFGIGQGCFFRAGFNLTCDDMHHPPRLLIGHNIQVFDISLPDGTARIHSRALNASSLQYNGWWSAGLPFVVSTTNNLFVAMATRRRFIVCGEVEAMDIEASLMASHHLHST
ncbi:hypothetical protein PR202_gb14123 [Eleusine coracana subsp. coracana]|uniref:Wall-associated receptor kinase galacturonan-binding domain-containing protein n=1 Tax=Eleusine coracana subsp. coracana TaxID=191504 RepID=A0AAV5EU81_ELECO|nr:hypothetical protein PR202_gb14123 [Eleusine coracana subsp. coracana]